MTGTVLPASPRQSSAVFSERADAGGRERSVRSAGPPAYGTIARPSRQLPRTAPSRRGPSSCTPSCRSDCDWLGYRQTDGAFSYCSPWIEYPDPLQTGTSPGGDLERPQHRRKLILNLAEPRQQRMCEAVLQFVGRILQRRVDVLLRPPQSTLQKHRQVTFPREFEMPTGGAIPLDERVED